MASLIDAGPIAQGLFGLIDSLFTSDDERAAAKFKLMELEKSGELAQIALNTQEAKHSSIFVAGWRPFIGWTCGIAFAWTFVLYPLLQFALWCVTFYFGVPFDIGMLPVMDLSEMMPVLLGMLGLGVMRSYEKTQGVERNSLETSDSGVDRRASAAKAKK